MLFVRAEISPIWERVGEMILVKSHTGPVVGSLILSGNIGIRLGSVHDSNIWQKYIKKGTEGYCDDVDTLQLR